VAQVIAFDISAGMLEAARCRLASLANVMLVQGSGRDLAWLKDQAVDLVLAVDVFPYLAESGPMLIAAMMDELHRALRPGGSLVVLNWTYRGDPEGDRRQAAGEAQRLGLLLQEDGPAGLRLWDASLYHLVRPLRQAA
jgi:SAM-dependent methyltransferase